MIISIIQAMLGFFLGGLSVYMANRPPRYDSHRKKYITLFCVLGGLLLIVSIIQIFQTGRRDAAYAQAMDTISGNQTNLDKTVNSKISNLESNLTASLARQQKIEMMFATNEVYDPDLREQIISSRKNIDDAELQVDDLHLWVEALDGKLNDIATLQKIEHDKELRANRSAYNAGFQYFSYAANTLTNLLSQIAKMNGDKVEGGFNGLPLIIDDFPFNLGNIKLQKTPGWEFSFTWSGDNALRVYYVGTCVLAINGNGSAETNIPGLPTDVFQLSPDNFKNPLSDHLKLIVAYAQKTHH